MSQTDWITTQPTKEQQVAATVAWDKLDMWADTLVGELRDSYLHVLHNPNFKKTPGSIRHHHCYTGGLLVHTAEVIGYARQVIPFNLKPIVTVAGIWHDIAKTQDYGWEWNDQNQLVWRETSYRRKIRHVAGSYAEFIAYARGGDTTDLLLEPEYLEEIGHCILAHHGRYEWGSPVEPQTEAALILHQADYWSANYGPGAKI